MSPSSDAPVGGPDPARSARKDCRMTDALVLPERLDRDAARDLHAELLCRRGLDLEIDGALVRTAGALAAQVLVAAARDWAAEGKTLTLAVSVPMREDLARLGLLSEFRLREMT